MDNPVTSRTSRGRDGTVGPIVVAHHGYDAMTFLPDHPRVMSRELDALNSGRVLRLARLYVSALRRPVP